MASYENEYIDIGDRFNLNVTHINEATSFICYYRNKIMKSKIPIKELLQYSDKLKIDKYVVDKKLKAELTEWKKNRSQWGITNTLHEIDLNNSKKCKLSNENE